MTLCEIYTLLGRLEEAVTLGKLSLEYAELGDNLFQKSISRSTLASAMHKQGNTAQALSFFREADHFYAQYGTVLRWSSDPFVKASAPAELFESVGTGGDDGSLPFIHLLGGYLYCDLLLELGQTEKVRHRASMALDVARRNNTLVNIGLDHLSLAQVHGLGSAQSRDHLDEAVRTLRSSGALCYLPLALLARASADDLAEVETIANRSAMRLYMADYHIIQSRRRTETDHAGAREHFYKAEDLVNEAGYHRRDKDLAELRRVLAEENSL